MLQIYLTLIDTDAEKQKFIIFYEQYRKLMFYIAKEILKDDHLAEDAVQEAFLRIAKNFHKTGTVTSHETKAFAVIITRNAAIDIYNKEKKITKINQYLSESIETETDDFTEKTSYKKLLGYILELPEIYRDVLYLNLVYDYQFNEIANLLGISTENARKRAQRGKKILQEKINEELI